MHRVLCLLLLFVPALTAQSEPLDPIARIEAATRARNQALRHDLEALESKLSRVLVSQPASSTPPANARSVRSIEGRLSGHAGNQTPVRADAS